MKSKYYKHNNESQVSEVKRAETYWTNYPGSEAIVTLAESEWHKARSARGTIPPIHDLLGLAGTWDLTLADYRKR